MAFRGRDHQLAVADDALAEAAGGRLRVVLVTGPAGIGKTRLADEIADRAGRRGLRVLWVPARAADRGTGFALWRRVADAAGRPLDLGVDPADEAPAGDDTSLVVADGLARTLRALADREPLLLVLDDLPDADPDSLAGFRALTEGLHGAPVAIVATVRTEPDGPGAPDPLPVRPHLLLALGPLGPDDARSLVETLAPGLARHADRLAERSGGNPLLLLELAALGDGAVDAVPGSVAGTVRRQLDLLDDDTRLFVEAGAVLGVAFDAEQALRTADDRALDPAGAPPALLVAVPGARLSYRFRHGLVRDAVLAAVAPARVRRLHARAAQLLTLAWAPAAQVAGHLEASSAPGDDPRPVVTAWDDAAGEAERARAWRAALHARRRSLTLLESIRPGGQVTADRSRTECALADLHLRLGEPGAARALHLAAAHSARAAGRADLLAQAALGLSGGVAGLEVPLHDEDALDLLRSADDGLRGDPAQSALRAHVLARLSVAVTERDDAAGRAELAGTALELAERAGDAAATAAALAAACDASPGPSQVSARRSWASSVVHLSTVAAEPDLLLLGLRLRLVAELESGDAAAFRASVADFERTALRHDRPRQLFLPSLWRAADALASGDLGTAVDLNAAAASVGAQRGSDHAFALTMSQKAVIELVRGGWSDLATLLEQVLREYPDLVGPRASLAWVHAATGRVARCHALLMTLSADGCRLVQHDSEWLPTLAVMADAAAVAGLPDVAAVLLPLLAPHEDVFVLDGIGDALLGVTAGYLGGLAAVTGDLDLADRYWGRALHANAAAGLVVPLLRVRAARASSGLPSPLAAADDLERVRREALALGVALPPAGWVRPAPASSRPTDHDPGSNPAAWVEDGSMVRVTFGGRTAQVRHGKGTRVLGELLRRPRVHLPATVLDGRDVQQHDLGPVLDDVGKRTYRRRLSQLEDQIDDAVLAGRDPAELVDERDALVTELARAAGLGGRPRTAGADAERARVNVTKAVGAALRALDVVHPDAAAHLRSAVRTGSSCAYLPDPAGRVTWTVSAADG